MTHPPQPPLKTIFPESSLAKRMAVRALRWYAKTLPKAPPFPPPGAAPVRILIQSMGGIGNSLMATPLIAATRKLYPNARIDLLTTPGAAELLKTDPNLNEVLVDQDGSDYSRKKYRALNRKIKSNNYQAAILTLNAVTFRFAIRSVMCRIPMRVIHRYEFLPHDDFIAAFNLVVDRDRDMHDVENNVALLEALSRTKVSSGPLAIQLGDSEYSEALSELLSVGVCDSQPIIGVCPGSSGWMSFKRWPIENYLELCHRLLQEYPSLQILFFAGPDEEDELIEVKNRLKSDRVFLISSSSLRQFAAKLSHCKIVLTNDSLPMHIRAALNKSVVAFFGPTNPSHTGPWSLNSRVLLPERPNHYFKIPYSPAPEQFEDQMSSISVGSALASIRDFMILSQAHSVSKL